MLNCTDQLNCLVSQRLAFYVLFNNCFITVYKLQHGDSKMDVSSLSRSDSASSTQSMQHGGMPELLIGLAYNGTTGRLSVEVIKGSNFKNMAMNRAPGKLI